MLDHWASIGDIAGLVTHLWASMVMFIGEPFGEEVARPREDE